MTIRTTAILFAAFVASTTGASTITDEPNNYTSLVRNNLSLQNASRLNGEILVGDPHSCPEVPTTGILGNTIFDWHLFGDLSQHLYRLETPDGVLPPCDGVYSKSNNPEDVPEVFRWEKSALLGAAHSRIKDALPTVTVDVGGRNESIANAGGDFGQTDADDLALNFVDATSLEISGSDLVGIIAPDGAVQVTTGGLIETTIGGNLSVTRTMLANASFDGQTPGLTSSEAPDPATWMLMPCGVASMSSLAHRRHRSNPSHGTGSSSDRRSCDGSYATWLPTIRFLCLKRLSIRAHSAKSVFATSEDRQVLH